MAVSAEEEAPVEAATVVRVFAPVAEGALTPEPPPDLSPKVMVRAEPPERVTAETRMHLLEEEQAPVEVSIETVFEPVPPEALVYPAALEVGLGWVKPEGTWAGAEWSERGARVPGGVGGGAGLGEAGGHLHAHGAGREAAGGGGVGDGEGVSGGGGGHVGERDRLRAGAVGGVHGHRRGSGDGGERAAAR